MRMLCLLGRHDWRVERSRIWGSVLRCYRPRCGAERIEWSKMFTERHG